MTTKTDLQTQINELGGRLASVELGNVTYDGASVTSVQMVNARVSRLEQRVEMLRQDVTSVMRPKPTPQLVAQFINGPRNGKEFAVERFEREILVPIAPPVASYRTFTENDYTLPANYTTGRYVWLKRSATNDNVGFYEWAG